MILLLDFIFKYTILILKKERGDTMKTLIKVNIGGEVKYLTRAQVRHIAAKALNNERKRET